MVDNQETVVGEVQTAPNKWVRVTLSEWNGELRLDARTFWAPQPGEEPRPTKQGFWAPRSYARALADLFAKAAERVEEEGQNRV